METGLGRLGLRPRDFWAMTPRELDAAIAGAFGPPADAAPGRGELESLMARYPDGDARHGRG